MRHGNNFCIHKKWSPCSIKQLCSNTRLSLYLVLDSCDISLGAPVHGGGEVSDRGGWNKQLPRLPVGVHTIAIVHLGKLGTVLGRRQETESICQQSFINSWHCESSSFNSLQVRKN